MSIKWCNQPRNGSLGIYGVAKGIDFCEFSSNFFQNDPNGKGGGGIYARNHLRAVKRIKNASLTMEKFKQKTEFFNFFNVFMAREAFSSFLTTRTRFLV